MKSQLASVFVIAAVACGGQSGEQSGGEPPVAGAGTTEVSPIEDPVPIPGDALQTTGDPAPPEHHFDAPPPTQDPVPVDGKRLRSPPTEAPVPVQGNTQPPPNIKDWQAHAPERYVITTCSEGAVPPSCSVEAVDEGRLVSRSTRFLSSDPWASAPIDDGKDPVASLFEEAALSLDSCTTSFELDPVYAYPSKIYFDCGQEGWGQRVTCFEPDTLDASRCQ